jgi:dihydropteroate synthase
MTINCRGNLIDLSTPVVMGIVNLTADSFYAGARHPGKNLLNKVEQLLVEGATFIDVGAYSTRPGAADVCEATERSVIQDALKLIVEAFPDSVISVDTFRSSVARAAVEAGAAMVNDVSAGHLDPAMLGEVASLKVPYVMMHMRGTPQTMQQLANYDDLVTEVLLYFSERIAKARQLGISDLILDPGFGFAKTLEQNFELLSSLNHFKIAGLPILAGISRKSMVYKPLGTQAEYALNGTTALHMVALQKGSSILRVHDVKEAVECIKLHQMLTTDDGMAHFSK